MASWSEGAHLHLVDVGGVDPLAAAHHHSLAAAVGYPAALALPRQDVGAELPVGRAVAAAALELEREAEVGGEAQAGWLQLLLTGDRTAIQRVTNPFCSPGDSSLPLLEAGGWSLFRQNLPAGQILFAALNIHPGP